MSPGSTQISLGGSQNGSEIRSSGDTRIMDDNTRVLIRVGSSLSGDCVGLTTWTTCEDVTILENCGCVSEDEIDGSVNVAIAVKLTVGVNVESVLVGFETALVKNG